MNTSQAAGRPEGWVVPVRYAAVCVFTALIVFDALAQRLAGRVTWTVAVAALPLVIVVAGFYRWRQICPLAWFAQLPARLGRPGRRKASSWLQHHYYYVAFAIFVFALWLRLVATNGDGRALAAFLFVLVALAVFTGATYTGKTWCNYICPVSFVEKIYTEPRNLAAMPNSQCEKCTACKPACPDINEENGYWKEIRSRSKRAVYYAFPGVVFSFYFYYYLQAGTWDYYFSGRWTNEAGVWATAFGPGHDARTAGLYFAPWVPRAAAAALTLASGALAGFVLFAGLERVLDHRLRERSLGMDANAVRHVMFTLAAFTAFVTFYTFAGAPTLRLLPAAPHLFQIAVVTAATLFLVRRLSRKQKAFAEETLARQIIRRWPWADAPPPADLHEAFLIHTIRSQTRATGYSQLLEVYKDAVREAVASGFVSRAEVQRLESLRTQLQISAADHEKTMAELDEEARARISTATRYDSPEKRLQMETYERALRGYLERASGMESADDSFVRHLRLEYGVSEEEHAAVLRDLLGAGGLSEHIMEALAGIEASAQAARAAEESPTAARQFLVVLLRRRSERAVEALLRGLHATAAETDIRAGLLSADAAERGAAVAGLAAALAPEMAERLIDSWRESSNRPAGLVESLRTQAMAPDPYIRAVALHCLAEEGAASEAVLDAGMTDEHQLVREAAICLSLRAARYQAELSAVEKMIALRTVPLFASLGPEELAEVAGAGSESVFEAGVPLCRQGEEGNEVFVLLDGSVEIWRAENGEARHVNSERTGAVIGELAVLDPAPRAATVIAGSAGARVLRLDGNVFRGALHANSAVAEGLIRTLVRRLRGNLPQAAQPARTSDKSERRTTTHA